MASSTTVTIPPALAFLVSNFHSLVPIKLDGSNFLLWKTQVENVLNANGFLGYIDGTILCPSQIQNSSGEMVTNSAFTLWKLIDSQLLACLTASLSQTTLPYVLGLHRSSEVWASLNSRYNSMTTTHIHGLRSKLYSLTKTSTMESYIDTIKTYAQKLAAAGNPLSYEDLVFHTLHGLSPAFNGFKTGIRTSGNTHLTFDALVTMLSGEDLQMTQDPSVNAENNTVLVATHSNPISTPTVSNVLPSLTSNASVPLPQPQYNPSSQILQSQLFSPSVSYIPSQQFFQPQFKNFNRGRGGRSPRFPRDPCGICGKTNHTTQYCYYRGQYPSFEQPYYHGQYPSFEQPYSSNSWTQTASNLAPNQWNQPVFPHNQWRGSTSSPMPSASYPFNGMQSPGMFLPSSVQMQSSGFRSLSPQIGTSAGSFGDNFQSGFPSISPRTFGNNIQSGFPSIAQANVAGYAMSASDAISAGSSIPMMDSGCQNFGVSSDGIQGHPWYFDSGATSHITNNLQNITHPQSTYMAGGVQVGNGSQLPITHSGSGQEVSSSSLPGALQQGSLSSTELL